MSHPERAPARLSSEADKKKVLGWALSILDALQYIHREEFVHGDLKLDNILVSCDIIKISKSPPCRLCHANISVKSLGN